MEKKCNRLVKVILTIIVVVSIFVININKTHAIQLQYTNYYGIEMTYDEYFTLIDLGFTEDEIYYMTEDTFEENKNLDATLLTRNVKYYKTVYPMYGMSYTVEVTEQEYLNHGLGAQPLDTLTTAYYQETSTISANGTKYRYKVTVTWSDIPTNLSYDVIGIGFNDPVYISSSVYFTYTYYNADASATTSTVYYDKKKTSMGGSAVFHLPSPFYGLSAMLYYDVKKNTNDTITLLTMCGDYEHSTSAVTATQAANHIIAVAGINFDPSVAGYFTDVQCAYAAASVNW